MNFEASHIDKRHFEHFSDVVCGQLMLVDIGRDGISRKRIFMRGPSQTYLAFNVKGEVMLTYHPHREGPFITPSDFPHVDPIAGWQPTSFKPPHDSYNIHWITPDLWKTITFTLLG